MKPFSIRFYLTVAAVTYGALQMMPEAHACKDSMAFTQDKQKHAEVSFALGAAARSVTADTTTAFTLALVPGVAKELYDMQGHGCASWNDLAWDAVGAAIGVSSANWVIGPNKVVFKMEF